MSESEPRFLPYGRQLIDEDDVGAVAAVLRGDWLTTGPKVGAFEAALAARLGAGQALACSSGTAGLHLAALALGVGPGHQVIVPALTFLATANACRLAGAEIVFADVDPDTGLMGREELARALERADQSALKAVLPVHLNGQCADLEAISELAKGHGLKVVDDACHALGTSYATATGERVEVGCCRHSDLTVFSFHPVKAIAMGEGGAVTSNDAALHRRLALLRSHGMTREATEFENPELALDDAGEPNPWYYEMPEPGLNYRASDIHCALGLSQLGKLDRFIAARRGLAARYDELLEPLAPALRPLARTAGCVPAWHLYVVVVDFQAIGSDRAQLMKRLREQGIGTQVHYLPLHLQPYYRRRYGEISLPGAESYYARCLSLPLFAEMTSADVERVAASLSRMVGAS